MPLPSSPWSSAWPPSHPSSWRAPQMHIARLFVLTPGGPLAAFRDAPGQLPLAVRLMGFFPPLRHYLRHPHSSPSSPPIAILGSLLVKPACIMHCSSSAENVLPCSARRTWLSWGSLISSPYFPSMPISKVISSSDLPRKIRRAQPDRRPPSILGPWP